MSMNFDLNKMIFSLVILRPKEAFFRWLESVITKDGLSLNEVYFPEECGVWLVPAIGTFDDESSFKRYLDLLKPLIAREELGKFGPDVNDVPSPLTLDCCNDFFEFEIRDRAQSARPYGGLNPP